MKMFVTFGQGQFGGTLAKLYLEFEDECDKFTLEEHVRRFMAKEFAGKYSFIYDTDGFATQRQHYGLSRLAKLDQHGNVRARIDDTQHCTFSTGIDGSITAGRGDLDANGFWEFPCEPCARRANERLASRMEQEKPFVSPVVTPPPVDGVCECPNHQNNPHRNTDPAYRCIECGKMVPTL